MKQFYEGSASLEQSTGNDVVQGDFLFFLEKQLKIITAAASLITPGNKLKSRLVALGRDKRGSTVTIKKEDFPFLILKLI